MWRYLVILFVFCGIIFGPNNWKVNPYFRLNSEPGHLYHINTILYDISVSLLFQVAAGLFSPFSTKTSCCASEEQPSSNLLVWQIFRRIAFRRLPGVPPPLAPVQLRRGALQTSPSMRAESRWAKLRRRETKTEPGKEKDRGGERWGGHVGNLRTENRQAWRHKLGTQIRNMQVFTWPQWKSNNLGFQGQKILSSKRKWREQRCGTKSLIFSCKCLSEVVFFLNWFVQQEGMRDGEWKGRSSSENYRWKKKKIVIGCFWWSLKGAKQVAIITIDQVMMICVFLLLTAITW